MKFRLVFISIIWLFSMGSYSQENLFHIEGSVIGLEEGSVQIWMPKSDSTFYVKNNMFSIVNGEFRIAGHLEFPRTTLLVFSNSEDQVFQTEWFYIEKGKQKLNLSIIDSKVEIHSDSEIFNEYRDFYQPRIIYLDSISRSLKDSMENVKDDAPNQNSDDSLNILIDEIEVKKINYLIEYITENPQSYIGFLELYSSLRDRKHLDLHETAFSLLDDELKHNHMGYQIQENIKHLKALSPGEIFPYMKLVNLNNEATNFSGDNIKTHTFVDFWFHNCGHCINQFPILKKLYSKFHKRGFQIIGITTDRLESENKWKKAIAKNKLPWLQLWDVDGANCRDYLINRFPTNYLINDKGEIVEKNISLGDLDRYLNRIM